MELKKVSIKQAEDLYKIGYPLEQARVIDTVEHRSFQLNGDGDFYVLPNIYEVASWFETSNKCAVVLPVYNTSFNWYDDRFRVLGKVGFATTGKPHAFCEDAILSGIDLAIKYFKKEFELGYKEEKNVNL